MTVTVLLYMYTHALEGLSNCSGTFSLVAYFPDLLTEVWGHSSHWLQEAHLKQPEKGLQSHLPFQAQHCSHWIPTQTVDYSNSQNHGFPLVLYLFLL